MKKNLEKKVIKEGGLRGAHNRNERTTILIGKLDSPENKGLKVK